MKQTVLIADDDLGLAELLARRCEMLGLSTIVVDNAECALFAVMSEQPDFAIFDVNMPAGDERNIFDLLATESVLADLPVIILTGRRDRETILQCENLSTWYVSKGRATWTRLRDVIHEVLEHCARNSLRV